MSRCGWSIVARYLGVKFRSSRTRKNQLMNWKWWNMTLHYFCEVDYFKLFHIICNTFMPSAMVVKWDILVGMYLLSRFRLSILHRWLRLISLLSAVEKESMSFPYNSLVFNRKIHYGFTFVIKLLFLLFYKLHINYIYYRARRLEIS